MNDIIQQNIAKGVTFSNIKDDRFKTVKISATMFLPLNKETAAANAILPMLLTRSCNSCKDPLTLNRKLSSLYGASINGYIRKMGETVALTISVSGIDDRYTLHKETISKDMVNLLCSMLFEPKIENGAFCSEDFAQEQRQLIESIDAEYNEKRLYAANRLCEIMFAEEAFGVQRYGSKKDVEKLTPSDAYKAWQNMLKTARTELMMIGNCDCSAALNAFKEQYEKINRQPTAVSTNVQAEPKGEVKEITETMDIAQSKMFMGFRTGGVAEPNETMAMRLAVAVLGGTPNSKLFMNVREKYSLCYYCGARYDRIKGFVSVDGGIDNVNIEKAKAEIINQLNEMCSGNISDFEINATKMSVCNNFNTMSDTISGTEEWYISQMLDKSLMSPKDASDKLNAVTKEEVIAAAKKIKLDTVYVLASESH